MFYIFTDGSAIGNPGPGGWAAVLLRGKRRWEMSGANASTTISEMELLAAARALRSLPAGSKAEVRSDSRYLIVGMHSLAHRWKRNGWRNRHGAPVQYQSLWEDLLCLNIRHRVRWTWIKGHVGHPLQSRADALAYREAKTEWHKQRLAA